ncbi:hypothetical protein [Aurantibacter aestuarii]|uniref:Peptidase M48 domain-containing protein n=1 Tax=Aurantibacter aestuarii TaxID=1266046 RepID=A0A2T1N8T9_9FLAO|nr:hypothetical protein [Aurantibacter aestuarii]PSG88279.1 hypothetical protein C7H52_08215 [Aurantibacter aestuarii]
MKCLIAFILMSFTFMHAQHTIPEIIEKETLKALSYYPELKDTKIELRFKKNIKKSTMQARPSFASFFRSRKNRSYLILISETFKISDTTFLTKDIPSDILIGWIGHELGHIMDYQNRDKLNLIWFGIKYLLSDNHIVEAERAADGFAVKHGMEDYILKTKDFILNHAKITPTYKDRIKRYYLSPEEIMEMVKERDALLAN